MSHLVHLAVSIVDEVVGKQQNTEAVERSSEREHLSTKSLKDEGEKRASLLLQFLALFVSWSLLRWM